VKIFRDLLTGPDNVTWDLVRCLTFGAAVQGLGLQLFVVVWRSQPFDFSEFGAGLGFLIGAGAAGMWARKDVEAVAPSMMQTTVITE
jgi:hypothetical protein